MSPERARQVANGILTVAGVALAVAVWRQPALRRAVKHLVPVALREIRPVHVAGSGHLCSPTTVMGAALRAGSMVPFYPCV